MRLERYLNEKFYMGMHQRVAHGGDYEVFINPSTKELRQFTQPDPTDPWEGSGYRYVLDFSTNSAYVFSLRMFHETFFDLTPKLPMFDDYWKNGTGLDYLFTGHKEFGSDKSDGLTHFYAKAKSRTNGGDGYFIRNQLEKLANQNWSWANKYLDTKKTQKLVQKASYGA